ncbi:DUF1906 domain-containing protein [Wenjunlia tyrosinilytica]|uniref:Rv2525c-like glycoside hydrolase-like domain-containing protein n=1 Tax=Wenjunlia tyrosinilytica TaxID=1544741 RepID=A0A918DX20_9ACTN|nr:DUF1906 domain-containing protein [Wenjunlia tyrosinilytica]GGO86570.1 hypothetical protein GCM10012280_23010 [Wenjunlia tyrosinilytica]
MRRFTARAALILAAMACLLTATPSTAPPTTIDATPAGQALHVRQALDASRTLDARQGPKPARTTGDLRAKGARIYSGRGFDTCTAPSLGVLTAWRRSSPYRAVGIYFGGRARACAQPRLTRAWVRSADRLGWRILPLYMGSQPPCAWSSKKRKYPITHPSRDGRREALDAVSRARALGIDRRSPLYLDIEGYGVTKLTCARKVLSYTQAWNKTVRSKGYFTGFYSSASAGVMHMAAALAAGKGNLPDVLWFARWNSLATLTEPLVSRSRWIPHRRVHQYKGNVKERHGGRTLLIDRNRVDAPVAIVKKK